MSERLTIRTRASRAHGGLLMLAAEVIGAIPSHLLRQSLYRRLLGMEIGSGTSIYRSPEIRSGNRIKIGRTTSIGKNAILDGRNGITIGDNVNLSHEVAIWTLQHDAQSPSFDTKGGPVVIEDYVWLSFRCTVLPGVTVGRGAVVAAGAIVTRDVAPHTIVAGTPAKVIGHRREDLHYSLDWRVPFI